MSVYIKACKLKYKLNTIKWLEKISTSLKTTDIL